MVGRAVAGPSETRAAWGTALVDAAPDAIVIADGEGRLVFVNSEAERLFGYARAELLGETVEILVPRRFRERHPAHRRAYYGEPRTRPMGSGLELYGVHRAGTELPVDISLSPIETAGGRLVMAVVRDASERQEQLRRERAARAEAEALARTNAELWRLAEQARLEVEAARRHAEEARGEAEAANRAKDTFLLTLSHELRTPLTPIFLWTGMLRQPDVPREVVARALDGIERGARSQTRLIEDLLDVSSIIAGKLHLELRPLALAEVVEAALEGVRAAAAAKAVVLDTVVAAEALVLGDTQRLGQIVTNLLTNAIKFSDTGGRVTTRLERTGDEVRLIVRDTGHGIAPAFLHRVFAPFEQGDTSKTRSYGGLGLGLTIVRHLVERHGGSVHAESAGLGKGSTFTVTLPAWQAPATHPLTRDEPTESASSLEGLRILVVDDDPEMGNVLETLLARCGAETRSVVAASHALALLAHWRADLLISDIAMPEQDGYALIHQLRAIDGADARISHMPAIALTAYARREDRQEALAAGFDEYIAKPVQTPELLAAIVRLIDARDRH